jgi:hypothetical protein
MSRRRRPGARAKRRRTTRSPTAKPGYIAVLIIGLLILAFLMRRVGTGL